jgi:hypothetical protein
VSEAWPARARPPAELHVEFGDADGPKRGQDGECHPTLHMPRAGTPQIEETTQDCYASLGSVVSEGGAREALIEDLPDAPAIDQAAASLKHQNQEVGISAEVPDNRGSLL